jgi:hypothetical protein
LQPCLPPGGKAASQEAAYLSYRHGSGYVARGAIFRKGKPVEIFEAHGATISAAEEAARVKAEEVCNRLKAATKKRAAKRR